MESDREESMSGSTVSGSEPRVREHLYKVLVIGDFGVGELAVSMQPLLQLVQLCPVHVLQYRLETAL